MSVRLLRYFPEMAVSEAFMHPGMLPEIAPIRRPQPVIRQGPKVGRNDPCPCGSGKKFKHCCYRGPISV